MPFPIGVLTAATATGDVVTAPGCPKVLIKGTPVSCIGDVVTGPACTGTVVKPGNPKIIAGGKPVAAVTSNVTGVNPVTGVPVATALLTPKAPKNIV